MTTKEVILAEIENVRESDLDELYRLIQSFVATKHAPRERALGLHPGVFQVSDDFDAPLLMARLRAIKIDGPEDMAENHDRYLSGQA